MALSHARAHTRALAPLKNWLGFEDVDPKDTTCVAIGPNEGRGGEGHART